MSTGVPAAPSGTFEAQAQLAMGAAIPAAAVAAAAPPPNEMFRRALGALRGRYVWVVAVGLVTGVVGAFAGWKMGKTVYESEGLIRIAYSRPQVLTDDQTMGAYEAFMRSQQLLIGSHRVVDAALQEDVWRATGRGNGPDVLRAFARDLTVMQPRGTEHIRISYQDADPNVPAAAVNAVIHAYENDYKNSDEGLRRKRIKLLTELEAEHQRQLGDLNLRIAALRGEASVDIGQLHAAAVQRLTQYEDRLAQIDLQLALSQKKGAPQEMTKTVKAMTPKQIAFIDPEMHNLLMELSRAETELSQLQLRLGKEHLTVIAAQRLVGQVKQRVEQRAEDVREWQAQAAQSPEALQKGGAAGAAFVQPVEVLEANREVLTKLVEQSRREVASLLDKRDEMETLRAAMQKTRQSLNEAQSRKEMLKLEMEMGDRLEITSLGQVSLAPSRDTRLRLGLAGGLGGACLPAMAVALFGIVVRRYRYADETETDKGTRHLRMLGVLPVLPRRMNGDTRASDAAQCVHQIRVMLQGGCEAGSRAYLVSSATAREGKTSLCVALGMSFAASGSRTLLIDGDMVGRGLTRGLKAEGLSGLREALETGKLSIRQRPDGLSVLTAGDSTASDAAKVSATGMRRLLTEARKHFDTILVDSGPILGSVEAAVVAREVDGVIFVITRGQDPDAVGRSVRHLESIGANVLGAVFNRANVTDFYRSFQGSSLRPEGNGARKHEEAATVGFDTRTLFGPIVSSVASCLPAGAATRRRQG